MRRHRFIVLLVLVMANIALADTFGTGANKFTIEFVNISGDASSANGTNIGGTTTFTDPSNDYRMGIYEITNDQWDKFVSSVGGSVTGSPPDAYDGSPSWTGTDVPANMVSWYEGAQFVNYLNTSTGHQAAYKFTGTQGTSGYSLGVWESGDAGYNLSNPYRNSNAYYFLPTEDEWVKAAYWNSTSLQTYATTDDSVPTAGIETNYNMAVGQPWDVGSGSEELNGTFDMMGNLWEWMESPYSSGDYLPDFLRGIRGGSYIDVDYLKSSDWGSGSPNGETAIKGFRVASKPLPLLVSEPNGGESLIAGTTYPISWSSTGPISNVSLEYSDANGIDGTWEIIDANTPNDGEYDWTVPEVNSEQCLVRVSDITNPNNVNDVSDAVFTVYQCQLDSPADLNNDCEVSLPDFAIMAIDWLRNGKPFDAGYTGLLPPMTWVYIDDPGVPTHEPFNGYMSKYETTNAQYCQFLNAALVSGDIYVSSDIVYGSEGSNLGADFDEIYFDTSEYSSYSLISYDEIEGEFSVITRKDNEDNDIDMSNHPVVEVSWYGATAFCNYYGFRLPTEWEWQAVADHTEEDPYTYGCGTTIDHTKANYYDSGYANPLNLSSYPYTSPVDHFDSYGYGMNDMAGNVWEWTDSISSGSSRVFCGGSWSLSGNYCTVWNRSFNYPYITYSSLGFRVCR